MEPPLTYPRFPISFPDGQVALGVRAGPRTDLPRALRGMGLTTGVPTIVLVTAGSRTSQLTRLGPFLEKVVVPVAEAVGATIVDDGARGPMAAMVNEARRRKKAGFPLLGVTPLTGEPGREVDASHLDPGHTHFVLVPGAFGAELARWTATVATALAGGNRSLTLVLAGGEPAWESVAASVAAERVVLAAARTGGVADRLANALAGQAVDARATSLARSGWVGALDPGRGATYVAHLLRAALSRPNALGPGPSQR